MKPLLVIPPAPSRWPALRDLLADRGPAWLGDLERRFVPGVPDAHDAYAVIPSGGQFLACAGINRRGDVGLLSPVFTRPDHRRRGYARQVTETVLSWFDMTGGKWLYLSTTAELDEGLYWKFGFTEMHRATWTPFDRLTMLRIGQGITTTPFDGLSDPAEIRDVARADWPALVALLQYRAGPDPRVPLSESAVSAEEFTLDLLAHLDRRACLLKGAFRGSRLIGLGSLATDQSAARTYAMIMPHAEAPAELRTALVEAGAARNYTQVDFPMETLAPHAAPAST